MYYHATLIFFLSIGFPVPKLGTILTHATHHPTQQMAHHLYGRLMHVTIKIALPINVKSAAFVLVLMEIAKQRQNLLAHHVMMVIIMRQPLANVTTMVYA
mgnify:CR=1 FL=1